MGQAYILVNTEKGREHEVYDLLLDMPEISGAHLLFGEWDVIAKVKLDSNQDLGTFILDKVRPLDGVNITSTLIIAK
jgi:DNA-binding Lrp family transcriptional regulator